MNRFWIGAFLLVLLLVLGIWTQVSMDGIYSPIGQSLEQAAHAALDGNWVKAQELADHAGQVWDSHRYSTAAAANHEPMEQADMMFAQLRIYGQEKEALYFAAACAQLSQLILAVGESHVLTWWNLL